MLTHEFVHLATPTLSKRYAWFMEGAATYVEPIARVRVVFCRPTSFGRVCSKACRRAFRAKVTAAST